MKSNSTKDALMVTPEQELIRRAQMGDHSAFAQMMTRYQKPLYRLVYRLVGNHDDTDDIVQETFVRAYQYLRSFDNERPFQHWLFGIAVKRCATFKRRLSQMRVERQEAEHLAWMQEYDRSWEDAITAKELRRKVHEAIELLPPQQRATLVLFELEGWKIKEIAESLGCAEGAVKTHLHRARARLRKELAAYVEGENDHDLPTDSVHDTGKHGWGVGHEKCAGV
jgi:RNA polymerase sigma-70 factor (ECF subfamily)